MNSSGTHHETRHPIPGDTSWTRRWACLAALFVLSFPIFLHDAGERQICDVREERVAITAREMWRAGEWILPTMNGELRLQKPPLAYWLPQAFAIFRGSFDEVTLWVPFGIAAVFCLFLTFSIGTSLGGWQQGFLAACLLLAMPLFANAGTTASADVLLTLATVAAWYFYLEARGRSKGARWRMTAFYACLGFGVLAKGPVILLFTLLPVAVEAVVSRSLAPLRMLRSLPGIAIFLVLSLAWPVLVSLRVQFSHPDSMIPAWQWTLESFGKILDSDGSEGGYTYSKHEEPWHFYLLRIVPLFGLGGIALIVCTLRAVQRRVQRRPADSSDARYRPIALWCASGLVVFSLFVEKKGFYLAPVTPAVALLTARFLEQTFPVWRRFLLPLAWAAAIAGAVALTLFTLARFYPDVFTASLDRFGLKADTLQEFSHSPRASFQFTAALVVAGALTVAWLAGKPTATFARQGTLVLITLVCTSTFALMAHPYKSIHYATQHDEWFREEAQTVRTEMEPGQMLFSAGRTPAGFLFYLDHRVQRVDSSAEAAAIPPGSGLIISEATLKSDSVLPASATAAESAGKGETLLEGYHLVQRFHSRAKKDRERILYFEKGGKPSPYRTRASNS